MFRPGATSPDRETNYTTPFFLAEAWTLLKQTYKLRAPLPNKSWSGQCPAAGGPFSPPSSCIVKSKGHNNDRRRYIMKWGCCLYFFARSIPLLNSQGTDDGCVTCAVGNFFKTGLEDWILPLAAVALQFLVPDSVPAQTPLRAKNQINNGQTTFQEV